MEQIILKVKDKSKISFLLQLINQLDFVEVEWIKKKEKSKKYDFFNSAGMWINRDINAKELRKRAWTREV